MFIHVFCNYFVNTEGFECFIMSYTSSGITGKVLSSAVNVYARNILAPAGSSMTARGHPSSVAKSTIIPRE